MPFYARPRFRRHDTMVVVRPFSSGRTKYGPGEIVDSERIGTLVRKRWLRMRYVGPENHPWTEWKLEAYEELLGQYQERAEARAKAEAKAEAEAGAEAEREAAAVLAAEEAAEREAELEAEAQRAAAAQEADDDAASDQGAGEDDSGESKDDDSDQSDSDDVPLIDETATDQA